MTRSVAGNDTRPDDGTVRFVDGSRDAVPMSRLRDLWRMINDWDRRNRGGPPSSYDHTLGKAGDVSGGTGGVGTEGFGGMP